MKFLSSQERISLIGIAHTLSDEISKIIRPIVIELPPYTEKEIEKILLQRIKLGVKGKVEKDVSSSIAKISEGNAAFAINLLVSALGEAKIKNDPKLTKEHLESVLKKFP